MTKRRSLGVFTWLPSPDPRFPEEEVWNTTDHHWPACNQATPIQDSIFTPSTTPQEDAVAVAVMHDQDNVSRFINVFEVGEVVAFRGTDGLPFNLLRITHNVSLRSRGPRSRVRGDFLGESARDDDNICYSLDPNWKNASMVYAHVLQDENVRVVTLSLEEAVTVTETKSVSCQQKYTAKFWR